MDMSRPGTAGVTHLVLNQDLPNVRTIRLEQSESSTGDLMVFDATFRAEDGSIKGILTGSLLVLDLLKSAAASASAVQSRLINFVINVEGDGMIVVGGHEIHPPDSAAEMVPGEPQVRAITGGTGTFIGARGEISTVRNEDGTYVHVLTLLNN